jgi:hypothetical protein
VYEPLWQDMHDQQVTNLYFTFGHSDRAEALLIDISHILRKDLLSEF